MSDMQAKVERLEELRRQMESCGSLEEAVDLLAEIDTIAKELIEEIDRAKREADAPS